MVILISAPSLDPKQNVSGISSVVQSIIANDFRNRYIHFLVGASDANKSLLNKIIRNIGSFFLLSKIIRKEKIDIFHLNLPFDRKGIVREVIHFWIAKRTKLSIVVHLHGGELLMQNKINRILFCLSKYMFENAASVIVLSDVEKRQVNASFHIRNIIVLPNAVELFPQSGRDQRNRILFFGRIHKSKGIEYIYEALVLLKERIDFEFILCGEGPDRSNLVEKMQLKFGDKFSYEGVVSGRKKNKIIESCDIFLLPSIYGEGQPIALLEAMQFGLVPVVTDDASMKTTVQDGITGFFVEKQNSIDLANKLEYILKNEKIRNIISDNARKTIEKNYSITNYIEQLNKIYNSIIK